MVIYISLTSTNLNMGGAKEGLAGASAPLIKTKAPNSTHKNQSQTRSSALINAFAMDAETASSTTAVPFKLASRVAKFCSLLIYIYIIAQLPLSMIAPPQHLHTKLYGASPESKE